MRRSIALLASILLGLFCNGQDNDKLVPPTVSEHYNENFIRKEEDGIFIYRWKRNNEKVSEYINTSCIVEPGGGIYKDYECKGLLVNGMMQGKWELKKCDTGVQQVANYNKGLLTGKYRAYLKTSRVEVENGKQKWIPIDTTFYETDFTNGNGLWKNFYSDGEVSEEGGYKSGKRDGKWVYYTKKGHFLYSEVYYKDGLIQIQEEYKIPPEYIEYEY